MNPPADNDAVILDHYSSQAQEHGLATSSTMADEITRSKEVDAILQCLRHVSAQPDVSRLLEVGCGNGYMLQAISEQFPEFSLHGVDFSPDMVELARSRSIPECTVTRGDVRSLDLPPDAFDVVVTERCVINVLDPAEQMLAFHELHRVLADGGYLVLIEAFMDGADNLNRARNELGLPPTSVPHHNTWLDKAAFSSLIEHGFFAAVPAPPNIDIPPHNFLSSHYFVSRVLYPAVTQREVLYNTEFVKFFSFLPPQGNYSPVQLYFLQKVAGTTV